MRRAILVFALALSAAPVVARAEPPPPPGIGFAGKRPPPGTATSPRWGDGKPDGQPIEEPATGRPYNLTHMAYAAVIMLAMLAFTVWLIRRNRRSG